MLDFIDFPSALALISFIGLFGHIYRARRHQSHLPPSPPGPNSLPFFGNVLSLPSSKPWETYASWSHEHKSDLISVRTFGQLSVIVNTLEAAKELLERRSAVYSDRPLLSMVELQMAHGTKDIPSALSHKGIYNISAPAGGVRERSVKVAARKARRLPGAATNVSDTVSSLKPCLKPETIAERCPGTRYGNIDRYIDIAKQSMAMLSNSVFPGAVLVNVFPSLRNLPDWLPGTYFKTYAKKCAALTREMRDKPFETVKAGMVDGTARPSLTVTLLEENETVSALTTVILALVLHPSVQDRAQAEIDRIIGRACLPTFENREALPYIGAICRETLRWMPVTPLGVTHSAYQDDLYKGWGVPKGTHIIINAWAMLHDPAKYEDPESFKPERFLNEDGTLNGDEVQPAFGFGRRICPGRHLASATLWIMVASILAVYDIKKAKDDTGADIPVSVGCTDGLVRHGDRTWQDEPPVDAIITIKICTGLESAGTLPRTRVLFAAIFNVPDTITLVCIERDDGALKPEEIQPRAVGRSAGLDAWQEPREARALGTPVAVRARGDIARELGAPREADRADPFAVSPLAVRAGLKGRVEVAPASKGEEVGGKIGKAGADSGAANETEGQYGREYTRGQDNDATTI
ncbi:hypothetical protein EW146_g1584 [Bondarzewia mesenterica]|uniref:Cytochrome P450 n=1 Tax=Bondarzewia mesenterica TaxID=1095465 RepID=A0A4S4M575_9AGAM|nr:hypothetical protein EW146_g1584 [Bondarzewia mesenterica]